MLGWLCPTWWKSPNLLVLSERTRSPEPKKSSLLVAAANHLGGRDNISVAPIQAQVREGNGWELIARLLHPKTPEYRRACTYK